jgi:hypothetical protein
MAGIVAGEPMCCVVMSVAMCDRRGEGMYVGVFVWFMQRLILPLLLGPFGVIIA